MFSNLFLGILFLFSVCLLCLGIWLAAMAYEVIDWLANVDNELLGSLDIDEKDVELFNRRGDQ